MTGTGVAVELPARNGSHFATSLHGQECRGIEDIRLRAVHHVTAHDDRSGHAIATCALGWGAGQPEGTDCCITFREAEPGKALVLVSWDPCARPGRDDETQVVPDKFCGLLVHPALCNALQQHGPLVVVKVSYLTLQHKCGRCCCGGACPEQQERTEQDPRCAGHGELVAASVQRPDDAVENAAGAAGNATARNTRPLRRVEFIAPIVRVFAAL